MKHMVHVCSTMWRIENQPSNSTSCSDNALCLLVLVAGRLYRGLQVTSSFSILGCVLKGCFEGGIFWRAKRRLKGIEDFNLEHCWWGPHPLKCDGMSRAVKCTWFSSCNETWQAFHIPGSLSPGPCACSVRWTLLQEGTLNDAFYNSWSNLT